MLTNRFETVLANTEESREIHYNVRYQVFCEETGFEESTRFPDHKERDEFDTHAAHFIIWDRLDRQWVGAMRLVDGSIAPMPCETICTKPLDDLQSARTRAREFSRLCILAKCRQTPSSFNFGLLSPKGAPDGQPIPTFFRQQDHEIFLRLLRATFAWSKANETDYCYGIITAALARVLKRFGIPLTVVGDPIQHRGKRTPYRYDVHEAESGIMATLPSYANLVRNGPAYVSYTDFVGTPTEPNEQTFPERPPTAIPALGNAAYHH